MLRKDNYFSSLRDLMFKNWSTHWDMKLLIIVQLVVIVSMSYNLLR